MDSSPNYLTKVPWDTKCFGVECFELTQVSEPALREASNRKGFYTIRVDPLQSKELLLKNGFYYADTLVVPFCAGDKMRLQFSNEIKLTVSPSLFDVLAIAANAFSHGRFHRDPNLNWRSAEARYANWLKQLHAGNHILGFELNEKLVAFVGVTENRFVLHAVDKNYRGKGLAKYIWSEACRHVLESGSKLVESSVSASNLPIINLYSSLGFRFKNAIDVYHFCNAPIASN